MLANCTISTPPPSEPWLAQEPGTVLEWFDTDRRLAAVLVGENILMILATDFKFNGDTLPQSIRTYSENPRVRVIGEKR